LAQTGFRQGLQALALTLPFSPLYKHTPPPFFCQLLFETFFGLLGKAFSQRVPEDLIDRLQLTEAKSNDLVPVTPLKNYRSLTIGNSLHKTLEVVIGIVSINNLDHRAR
jgi:hypothetical protein